MKKHALAILISLATLLGVTSFSQNALGQALRIITPPQGGTGIGSVTAGDVGECLKVFDDAPFTYELGVCGTSSVVNTDKFATSTNNIDIQPNVGQGLNVSASSTFSSIFNVGGLFNASSTSLFQNIVAYSSTTLQRYTGTFGTTTQATSTTFHISSLFNFGGDVFSDLVGTGLQVVNGVLEATLGTSIDISAETNLTAGDGITLTDDDLDCDTATSAIFGCLSSADWSVFNNKVSSTSLSGASVISYTPATGVITTTGGTFGSGNYIFPGELQVNSSTTLQNFTAVNGTTSQATSTAFRATTLGVGTDYINDITGNQLTLTGFSLGVSEGAGSGLDADTLDTVDSGSFLRSDASDSYTSGTLTFDAGTALDLNTTSLTVADTAIGFDGVSTELTFTGNMTMNTDDLAINKSTGLVTLQNLLVSGSSTLQRFTATHGTTTQATSTSLAITNLTSALVSSAADGSTLEYAGTSCTNQFVRALSALGVATCATVANTDLANSSITVTDANTTLTIGGSPVSLGGTLTATLNLAKANTWSALQTFGAGASTTNFTFSGSLWGGGNSTTTSNGNIYSQGIIAASSTTGFLGVGSNLTLSRIGNSTYSTVQHLQDIFHSSGWVSGGTVADIGGNAISVSAGTGLIRATDSAVAQISYFDWTASTTITVPQGEIRYLGIEYNSGSPRVASRTVENWDLSTDFQLGSVVNEGGTIHITTNPQAVGDHAANMIEREYQTMPLARDERAGGLILGESGTRNITVSAGALWDKLNRYAISAIDTSVSGSFDTYVGATKYLGGQTQWDNLSYNNAGTLASTTVNRYSNLWFYIESDGALLSLYGTSNTAILATAEQEGAPATLPVRCTVDCKLIGRLTFQESGATAELISSAFTESFTASAISDHSSLSNLAWTSSGHTGTANTVPYFTTSGIAAEFSTSTLNIGGIASGMYSAINTWTAGNIFTSSSTILNLTSVISTSTSATTTNFAVTGSATSTFGGGISLTTGCFAIGTTCIGGSGGTASSTLLSDNNTWTGSNVFNASPSIGGQVNGILLGGSNWLYSSSTNGSTVLGLGSSPGSYTVATANRDNVGIGENSLKALTSGFSNVAIGNDALDSLTTGNSNVAVGWTAGNTGSSNAHLGVSSGGSVTGSGNITIGAASATNVTSGSSNIIIGAYVSAPVATDSSQLNIGNVLYGSGLYSILSASAVPTATGKIGIGTTTPFSTFAVAGGSLQTYPLLSISTSTASATSTALIVDSNGNLGIGTSSPGSALSVSGSVLVNSNATSTWQNSGINLTGGCFSINNVCITSSGAVADGGPNSKWATSTNTTDIQPNADQGLNVIASSTFMGNLFSKGSFFASTTALFTSGLTSYASSTFQDFTGVNATTSQATTSRFAITSLTSALVSTGADGGTYEYPGTACTNQFVRSLSVLGIATCETVANTDLANSSVTVNGTTIALGASETITAASSTLLANTNTWTGGNIFNGSTTALTLSSVTSTSTHATSTNFSISSFFSFGGDRFSDLVGTGLAVVGDALTTTLGTAVDLASEVGATILPIANGGTNKALTLSNGGLIWSDADSFEVLSANANSGLSLVSGGAGTPSWFAPTLGSILFAGTNGALTQNNPSFFWDNTNFRLGVGTTSPWARLSLSGLSAGTTPIFDVSTSTATATSSVFTIASNGFVGVGTTSPNSRLSINGSAFTKEYNQATSSPMTIDWEYSNQQQITIGATGVTLNLKNGMAGGTYRLIACQDKGGSDTITVWDAQILWSGGTAPTLTSTQNKCDVISFLATYGTTTDAGATKKLQYFGAVNANF